MSSPINIIKESYNSIRQQIEESFKAALESQDRIYYFRGNISWDTSAEERAKIIIENAINRDDVAKALGILDSYYKKCETVYIKYYSLHEKIYNVFNSDRVKSFISDDRMHSIILDMVGKTKTQEALFVMARWHGFFPQLSDNSNYSDYGLTDDAFKSMQGQM